MSRLGLRKKLKIVFSDSEEENQNSDTTNSDEDSDGLEIRLDFQPIPYPWPIRLLVCSTNPPTRASENLKISEFKQLTRIYTLNMKRKKAK